MYGVVDEEVFELKSEATVLSCGVPLNLSPIDSVVKLSVSVIAHDLCNSGFEGMRAEQVRSKPSGFGHGCS